MTRRLRFAAISFVLVFFGVYAGAKGYLAWTVSQRTGDRGWLMVQHRDRLSVVQVSPDGPATSLRVGDVILQVNGEAANDILLMAYRISEIRPGAWYTVKVLRGDRTLSLALRMGPMGPLNRWGLRLITLALSLFFLIPGAAVFLLRPDDERARLMALLFALSTTLVGTLGFTGLTPWLVPVVLVGEVAGGFFFPVFLHFFLLFPEPSPLFGRFPRLRTWIYLPTLVTVPFFGLAYFVFLESPQRAYRIVGGWTADGIRLLAVAYVVAGLGCLVASFRRASPEGRRKLRVVLAGSLAAVLPTLGLVALVLTVDVARVGVTAFRLLLFLTTVSWVFLPLGFGYAILRHQVIPVRLIVRLGIRYLLVSRGFLLVEAAVLALALSYVLSGSRGAALDRLWDRADIVAAALTSLVVLAALTTLHRRVMPAIDRRFFRGAYDSQRLLTDLGQEVRAEADSQRILALALARVEAALHPDRMWIYVRGESADTYAADLVAHQGAIGPGGGEAPPEPLLERLRAAGGPVALEGAGDAVLLVPVRVKGEILGALALGPRRGDLPYSREDRDLLSGVAWQVAFGLENARLVRRKAEEERLRLELEMASEVQRRLFPQSLPEHARLDLFGLCHPARGVGGDYYDVLQLGQGRIGIAVADVAGKGISAALLMSVVQASLRSQATPDGASLAELAASMNRLLYHSTPPNSFATFFYGRYDESSGRLTYVNAGHNPPVLLRSGDGLSELALLKRGGLVLGAVKDATYEEETLSLAPGDVLVAYTDGVTEAWNERDEEFGEERLGEVMRASRDLHAAALAERIVAAVQAWSGSRPQADDLTLVVARVRPA